MISAKLLRRREVQGATGLSRSAIYEKMAEGAFPKPIQLGLRSVAWVAAEVDDWIAERIRASRERGLPKAKRATDSTPSR